MERNQQNPDGHENENGGPRTNGQGKDDGGSSLRDLFNKATHSPIVLFGAAGLAALLYFGWLGGGAVSSVSEPPIASESDGPAGGFTLHEVKIVALDAGAYAYGPFPAVPPAAIARWRLEAESASWSDKVRHGGLRVRDINQDMDGDALHITVMEPGLPPVDFTIPLGVEQIFPLPLSEGNVIRLRTEGGDIDGAVLDDDGAMVIAGRTSLSWIGDPNLMTNSVLGTQAQPLHAGMWAKDEGTFLVSGGKLIALPEAEAARAVFQVQHAPKRPAATFKAR